MAWESTLKSFLLCLVCCWWNCLIRHKTGENWFMNSHHHRRRQSLCHFNRFIQINSFVMVPGMLWMMFYTKMKIEINYTKWKNKIELWKKEKGSSRKFSYFTFSFFHRRNFCNRCQHREFPLTWCEASCFVSLSLFVLNLASGGFSISISRIRNIWNYFRLSPCYAPCLVTPTNRNKIHFT